MEIAEFLQQHLQKGSSHATKTYFPFSCVEGGLPQGGLIEISGAVGGGKLEALLRFLGENPSLRVAWLEEGSTTYPCAFPQHGVELDRVLFVNTEGSSQEESSQLLSSAHQILRSQIFEVLVLIPSFEKFPHTTTQVHASHWSSGEARGTTGPHGSRGHRGSGQSEIFGEIELRRLQLSAEKSGTTIFVIRETPSVAQTWPLAVQLQITRVSPSLGDLRGELSVKILKYRSQPAVESSQSQALA
jgi:hypothetical protein